VDRGKPPGRRVTLAGDIWTVAASRWLNAGGARTRYVEAGSGPPVVFVHGNHPGDVWAPDHAGGWEYNLPAIAAAGYRCFAFDKLGQGLTDNPVRDADWSLRGQVAHLRAFIEALGLGPVHLVGHSRGGYVACRVALDRPELVKSLVLADSNTAAPGPGRNELEFLDNPHRPGTRAGARWVVERNSYRGTHISEGWLDVMMEILATPKYRESITRMQTDGLYHAYLEPMLERDRDEMFARLRSAGVSRPMQVIWGYNDPTATLEGGFRLYELLALRQPDCAFHVLNHAGHYSYREQPEAFNRVVLEFFAA
jgi:2-hydroxy-6-oxonona-2,4-dienedioate hydrolase